VELQENESKVYNKFQWFLFAGIIPLIFAIVVSLIVFTFAGVDVVDAAKKYGQYIPGISKLIPNEEGTINIEAKLQKDVLDLEAVNKDQLASMEKLEIEIEKRQGEIDSLQAKIEKLTEELRVREEQQQETKQTLTEIGKMYESMSAKNAAAILTELNEQEALKILKILPSNSLGSILEKMAPVDAARYTELLAK
jgi:flagellar protein FlbB